MTSGTAFRLIDNALGTDPRYRARRAGDLDAQTYAGHVTASRIEPLVPLTEDQANLTTRFPIDEERFVDAVLASLIAAGTVPDGDYPRRDFTAYRELVEAAYDHGDHLTYIFPEEARLLFALAHIVRPRTTVFAGSYYGYWAAWSYPAVAAAGGTCELVDIDEGVLDLSARNAEALGFASAVRTRCADATTCEWSGPVDLCGLDAEGPRVHPDPDLQDKAIYAPIMERLSGALAPGALLVAHNMLLDQVATTPYFTAKIANNRRQYARFQRHLDTCYEAHVVVPTTEGVGVYRRRADGGAV